MGFPILGWILSLIVIPLTRHVHGQDLEPPIYINVGSSRDHRDHLGNLWVSDSVADYFNTGETYESSAKIRGTKNDALYRTGRIDSNPDGPAMTYELPLPNGEYDVRLHFAEIDPDLQKKGKRVFDVYMEGKPVFTDLDVYKEAAGFSSLVKNATVVVLDQELTIEFLHGDEHDPMVSAIELHQLSRYENDTTSSPSFETSEPSMSPSSLATLDPSSEETMVPTMVFPIDDGSTVEPTSTAEPSLEPSLTPSQLPMDETSAPSSTWNTTTIFINAGGPTVEDDIGNIWVSDSETLYFNTGKKAKTSSKIYGTIDDMLFQTERWAAPGLDMKYDIPVENGLYDVYLYFSETYSKTQGKGKRKFNVWVEDYLVLPKLDVFREAGGGYTALIKSILAMPVTDNVLTVEFGHIKDGNNPMISAISVHPSTSLDAPPAQNGHSTPSSVPTRAPSLSPLPSMSMEPSPFPFEPLNIFLNAGGGNFTDSAGNEWVADNVASPRYFNTGVPFKKVKPISDTEDDELYQTERYDKVSGEEMAYEIPVADGAYEVDLHFAELYSKALGSGQRVFDVYLEGDLVLEKFDIFDEVGGFTALVKTFTTQVSDGALSISFEHRMRDPKICAIEIRALPPTMAPSSRPSSSAMPTSPTASPAPSSAPSDEPTMFPTVTPLPWVDLDDIDQSFTGRHECSFVQAGNKFYLFGGRERPQRLEIYDYTNDIWTVGALVPEPLNHFQAIMHEGLIWVIGAFNTNRFPDEVSSPNLYVYDPANDVWMKGPKLPRPRGSGGLAVYKGSFYLLGGNTDGHNDGFVSWMDKYVPFTGDWFELPDAPHARDHFQAAVIGNKLYATGGRLTSRRSTFGNTVKEVDVFDLTKRKWLTSDLPEDIPAPRAGSMVAEFQGQIMVMGGESATQSMAYWRVDALNVTTGRWSSLTPLNYRRHGTQAIVSGDGVYVVAGSPNRGGGNQRRMEVYNSDSPRGVPSKAGILSWPASVTIRGKKPGRGKPKHKKARQKVKLKHVGGNQGVFVNSAVIRGPDASLFTITNKHVNKLLVRINKPLVYNIEYTGRSNKAIAQLDVTYSSNQVLNVTLVGRRR